MKTRTMFCYALACAIITLGLSSSVNAETYPVVGKTSVAPVIDVTLNCTPGNVAVTLVGNPTKAAVFATFEGGKATITDESKRFHHLLNFGNLVEYNLAADAVGEAVTMTLDDKDGNALTGTLDLGACTSGTVRADFSGSPLVATATSLSTSLLSNRCGSAPVYVLRIANTFANGVRARFSFGGEGHAITLVGPGKTIHATSDPIESPLSGNGVDVTYALQDESGAMTTLVATGVCRAQFPPKK